MYKIYHPEIFQGSLKKRNYFEGWYYKVVDSGQNNAIAIIPGVSIGREEPDHAFVQVLDGKENRSYYYRYDIKDFQASDKKLDIRIGNNHFTRNFINVDCDDFSGKVFWLNTTPFPTSILSPGIMGWYSFVPRMECYHGIVSMHHQLSGVIKKGNHEIAFEGGKGYIEKDWGTSFPRCWIWAHSNHFRHPSPVSVMVSVAHIPWMGNYFVGFLVAFLFNGDVKIFATYNGSKKKVSIVGDTVNLAFLRGNEELQIKAHPAPGAPLHSPIKGLMTGKVNESLQATLELSYTVRNKLVFEGEGTSSGLEVAGDTEILLSDSWSVK